MSKPGPRTTTTTNGLAGVGPGGVTDGPLLVGRDDLSTLLGISTATLDRLDAGGKLPRALKLGGRKLWRMADASRFVELGLPDRATFERLIADQ